MMLGEEEDANVGAEPAAHIGEKEIQGVECCAIRHGMSPHLRTCGEPFTARNGRYAVELWARYRCKRLASALATLRAFRRREVDCGHSVCRLPEALHLEHTSEWRLRESAGGAQRFSYRQ